VLLGGWVVAGNGAEVFVGEGVTGVFVGAVVAVGGTGVFVGGEYSIRNPQSGEAPLSSPEALARACQL
jgi:hypothetical protein